MSSKLGDPDIGLFGQSFYTAATYGKAFVNTFNEGGSHFRQHLSFIFYLILPFYMLYKSVITLLFIHTLAVAIGAVPVYLIAKEKISESAGLFFAVMYLLFHPVHGVNYDPFSELGFAVTPLLFAFYFFMKRKLFYCWIFLLITLTVKEDMSFIVMAFGLYGIYISILEMLREKPFKFAFSRLFANSLAMFIVGAVYIYLALYVIIPYFSNGHAYGYFSERYGYLGSSLSEVAANIFIHPGLVLKSLLIKKKIFAVLEVLMPFGFLSLLELPVLLIALPSILINLLSDYEFMYNSGTRYLAPWISFIVISAIFGMSKILNMVNDPAARERRFRRLSIFLLILMILVSLVIDNTPFRIGFKYPKINEHQRIIMSMVKEIPLDASVSTQVGIYNHLCNRLEAYCGFKEGVKYIMIDSTSKWYSEQAGWDKTLPEVLKKGDYELVDERDGVKIYRKIDAK